MNIISGLARIEQEDIKMLGFLRKNARQTLTRISKKARIPISTVFDRLKRLEETGIITRHTCFLDMKTIGFSVRVLLFLKIDDSHSNKLEKFLTVTPNVNSLVKINGNWNFVVEALFRDKSTLELFVDDVRNEFKGIKISIHYVLEDVKRESFLIENE